MQAVKDAKAAAAAVAVADPTTVAKEEDTVPQSNWGKAMLVAGAVAEVIIGEKDKSSDCIIL